MAVLHARPPQRQDLSGGTPLHRAAYCNANPAIVAALLDAGADPAIADNFEDTALRFAAKRNVPNATIAALLREATDAG